MAMRNLNIRVSDDLYETAKRAAKDSDQSLSRLARAAILREAKAVANDPSFDRVTAATRKRKQ